MSLDGLAIRALSVELHQQLMNGRIDKIQQPDATTITLNIRQGGQNHKLLLSAHPQTARIGLTRTNKPNPMQPPLFCMVLRKHLEGSKIINIQQIGWERIIHITCQGYDELGEPTTRVLIGEFMGKHSNLILINPEKNLVLDSIKRIHGDMSQYRQVLPGINYVSPPPQNKLALEELTEEALISLLLNAPASYNLKKILLDHLAGFGPQSIAELLYRSGLSPESKVDFLGQYDYQKLMATITHFNGIFGQHQWTPTLVYNGKKIMAFAPFCLEQFQQYEQHALPSMSQLIEQFIGQKENQNSFKQRVDELERVVHREIERCEKKLALQIEKVQEGTALEHLKIWGELMTANLYQLKQGDCAQVINYYDPDQAVINIPMDPHLTPNDNAQKYFKKYAKAKVGAEKAAVQAEHTQEEIAYLDSILDGLASAQSMTDLQDIRLELEQADYVKAKLTKQNRKQKKEPVIQPLTVQHQGFTIMIGKNNIQNDYLTLKVARNNDLWFHAKDIPGSHVIIKNHHEQREIPKEILDLAAHLAAYFSKSRHSALVPVDYTLKKHVKKPSGAKPGMMIYENQKTIFITPDEEAIEQLIINQK